MPVRAALPAVVMLLVAVPRNTDAQSNTGTSQGGGLLNAGAPLVVTTADAHTRELVRGRKPGPGRMTIQIGRDSELAKQFREQLTTSPRRPIRRLHLEFRNLTFYVPEAERSAPAQAARTVLEEVTVIKILDSSTRGALVSEVTIVFSRTGWLGGYPIKWRPPPELTADAPLPDVRASAQGARPMPR